MIVTNSNQSDSKLVQLINNVSNNVQPMFIRCKVNYKSVYQVLTIMNVHSSKCKTV